MSDENIAKRLTDLVIANSHYEPLSDAGPGNSVIPFVHVYQACKTLNGDCLWRQKAKPKIWPPRNKGR